MARDILLNIAKFKNATVSYQGQQVNLIPVGGSKPGSAIILSSNTGLIGQPTQTTDGIFARTLINPSISVWSQVQINESDILAGEAATDISGGNTLGLAQLAPLAADGLYTVCRIDLFGDTRGNPWYMDLGCLAAKGPPPVSSSLSQYAPALGPG
jgi:hypothetical protein